MLDTLLMQAPAFIENFKNQFDLNFIQKDRWKYLLTGLGHTLEITIFSAVIGIVIGVLIAAVRSSYDKNEETLRLRGGFSYHFVKFLNFICKLYLTIIRGTPVVVQLLITYFIIFASSSNGVAVAICAFGINSGAYVAEIFRGGIMSIDEGQFEAGRSIGFNYFQTMRYIILPQMFKTVLPTLLNEFIALLKETSVAGYVAVTDLTKAGSSISASTYSYYMPLLAVALIYLVIVLLLTKLVGSLERRLRKNER
jgi:arginine/lysine/histidine transport system permease protein